MYKEQSSNSLRHIVGGAFNSDEFYQSLVAQNQLLKDPKFDEFYLINNHDSCVILSYYVYLPTRPLYSHTNVKQLVRSHELYQQFYRPMFKNSIIACLVIWCGFNNEVVCNQICT